MFQGTITNPSRWITIDEVVVKDFNGEHALGELVFEKEPGIAE